MTTSRPGAAGAHEAVDLDRLLASGDLDIGVFTSEELALLVADTHLDLYPGDGPVLGAGARSLIARGYAASSANDRLTFGGELSLVAHARSKSSCVASLVGRFGDNRGVAIVYVIEGGVALEERIEAPGIHAFKLRKAARAVSDLARAVSADRLVEVAAERTVTCDPADETFDPVTALVGAPASVASLEVVRRDAADHLRITKALPIRDQLGASWLAQARPAERAWFARQMSTHDAEALLTALMLEPLPA